MTLHRFESLLDSPALMVKACEQRGRECHLAHAGGRRSDVAIRGDLANRAHPSQLSGSAPVAIVIRFCCPDRQPGLIGTGLKKFLRHVPAAYVVTTHDEADVLCGEQDREPGCGIAAVDYENIIWPEQIKGWAEHVARAYPSALCAGVQGQFSAWQLRREQALARRCGRAAEQARPPGGYQRRGVSGHHTKSFPAHEETGFIHAQDDQVMDLEERRQMQSIARLGKGAISEGA